MMFVPPAIGFSNLRQGPSCASTHSCHFIPAIPGMPAIDPFAGPLAELDEAAGVVEGLEPDAAGADFGLDISLASGPWRLLG